MGQDFNAEVLQQHYITKEETKTSSSTVKITGFKNNKHATSGWRRLLLSQPAREPSVKTFTFIVGVTIPQLFSIN